jgi:two-component system, LytTR family, sensor kinase
MNINYSTKEINLNRILFHASFWIIYVLYYTLVFGSFDFKYPEISQEILIVLPVRMAATYFTLYILFRLFFYQKKYTLFIVGFMVSAVVFSLLQNIVYHYIIFPAFYHKLTTESILYFPRLLKGIINIYFIVTVATTIKLLKKWYTDEKYHQDVEKQRLEAELNLLKAQVHPHFLFNTLNNLYALTLKKSDKASEVVLKLSELLSYMLYECNVPKVQLDKELEMINNYISLEKLRYSDVLDIKIRVTGDTRGINIAPMLILPFVENSFKHGASGSLTSPWIKIDVQIQDNFMVLKVANSKNGNKKTTNTYTEGIGLKNVRRRLELLYTNLYDLQIKDENNIFQVILTLNVMEKTQ